MLMRMKTDDAVKIRFSLRPLQRAADHIYCHNYTDVNQAGTRQHIRFGQEFKTAPSKIIPWTGITTTVSRPSQWTHSCPDSGQGPIRGWNVPHDSDRNRAQDFPIPTFASVSLCDEDRRKQALALKWNETFVWWLTVELGNVTLSRSMHRVVEILSDI